MANIPDLYVMDIVITAPRSARSVIDRPMMAEVIY